MKAMALYIFSCVDCDCCAACMVQNLDSQSAKGLIHLADSGVDLLVQSSITGDVPKYLKSSTVFSSAPSMEIEFGGHAVEQGWVAAEPQSCQDLW